MLRILVWLAMMSCAAATERLDEEALAFVKSVANVQDANVAQKQIRVFAQEDPDKIFALFKMADQEHLPRAQLFLSNAYHLSRAAPYLHQWSPGCDAKNGVSSVTVYDCLDSLRKMLWQLDPTLDFVEGNKQRGQILAAARQGGSVYAHLVELVTYKEGHLDFWQAARIRPYLEDPETSFPELLYVYGQALMEASHIGFGFYYEGLSFINRAGFLRVECFDELSPKPTLVSTFEEYQYYYVRFIGTKGCYYEHEGLFFVDGKVIAPTRAAWKGFQEKFLTIEKPSPLTIFECISTLTIRETFSLQQLYRRHKIVFWLTGLAETDGLEISCAGSWLGELRVHPNWHHGDKVRVVTTLKPYPDELKPLITFIQKVLCASGSPHCVRSFFLSISSYPVELGLVEGLNDIVLED